MHTVTIPGTAVKQAFRFFKMEFINKNPKTSSLKLDKSSDKSPDKSYKSTINQLFSTTGFGSRGVESLVWFGTL